MAPGQKSVRTFRETTVFGQVDHSQRGACPEPGLRGHTSVETHNTWGPATFGQNTGTHWSWGAR